MEIRADFDVRFRLFNLSTNSHINHPAKFIQVKDGYSFITKNNIQTVIVYNYSMIFFDKKVEKVKVKFKGKLNKHIDELYFLATREEEITFDFIEDLEIISIKFTDTKDFIPFKDSELYKKTSFIKAVKKEIQENIYVSITCELLDEVVYEQKQGE